MSEEQTTAEEQRQSPRDIMDGTSCFVQLGNGSVIEGVVRDVSDGGIGIVGKPEGLLLDDEVGLTLVVMGDQRVGCRCRVRHIEGRGFGLSYVTKLQRLEETRLAVCVSCRYQFPPDLKFCGYCGRRLKITAKALASPEHLGFTEYSI